MRPTTIFIMNQPFNYINIDNFLEHNAIEFGPFSNTSLTSHKETQEKYAQRLITIEQEECSTKFKKICDKLFKMEYPCSVRPSYASLPDSSNNIPPILYIPYAENQSLKSLIQRLEKGELIENFDLTQIIIIIYGILLFLDAIHKDNQLHGRLKISNILLDSQFYPLVSDSLLYNLNEKGPINDSNIKMLDYIVSLPPEVIQNNTYSPKSDIYSLGIIILQLLTHQINIYSDTTDDCLEILRLKRDGQSPNIPEIENQKLHNLICRCLEFEPDKRPTTQEMITFFDEIGTDDHKYDTQRLIKFKSIINSTEEIQNPKIRQMKKLADEGDPKMMYEYGRARFMGAEDCPVDLKESIKYISKAAQQGLESAKSLLQTLHNEFATKMDSRKVVSEEVQAPGSPSRKFQQKNKMHLKDDPFFTRKKADINQITEKVKKNYNKTKLQEFDQLKLGKKGFIFTEGAIKRLTKLYNYLESSVPVLLEGPTGTSKTLSSEIVCQLRKEKKPLLRFNLSSETKASYLLGRYKGDIDSWAGISMTNGPFIDAYENGHTLLLDEINLASPECLQFIEEALDSGKISIDIPGMPLREIKMHPDFRLIATQNPNKGHFANKRHDFDTKFLSRFQVINFPSFDENEYTKIAQGLASSFNYEASDQLIHDLVNFHMTWSSRDDVKGDVQCFTVREIAATVHALSENHNMYDTIMTIYGARYPKDKKEKLREHLLSYESFKNLTPNEFEYPENFPKCYHNKNLEEALKAIFFSFDNKRNVILTGLEGSGITQLAKWVAKFYDEKNNSSNNEEHKSNNVFFCVCTEETKCSDLIGHQKPSDKIESGQELITFKPGLLTEGIQQGCCVVLDSLDEAPSTVTERLNGLLDEKYDGEKKMFEIPENPKGEPIEINPSFRLLCTCRIDKISQMSPAFINRFDVIVLNNQLENIDDQCLKNLIELLMTTKFNYASQTATNSNNNDDNNTVDNNENSNKKEYLFEIDDEEEEVALSWGDEDDDDLESASTPQQTAQNPVNNATSDDNSYEFKPSSELVDLVYRSFDRSSTMYKLSQLCKAVSKFVYVFNDNSNGTSSNISEEDIVKFTVDLLIKTDDFSVPKEIEKFLIDKLSQANADDDGQYFFQDSPLLRSFIAKLFAASIINLPLCVYGPTGVGKTSAARAFAKMRTNQLKRNIPFLMHSFHAGTKPNHFYGTTTIRNGRIAFINGTLTTSVQKGCTFIADEMNLSTISTMKSLAPVLEPCIGEKVFIPGVGETATIHQDFFFIACQNELGTIGRNVIPSSIASRFRILYYPIQQEDDIASICYDISKSFYSSTDVQITPSFTPDDAHKIGKFMIKLNQEKQKIIPQWSLRDITKLFKRIRHQDEYPDRYENLTFYHNILFYTLAPVSKNELKGIFDAVLKLIGDTFVLDSNQRKELKESFKSEASIQNIQGKGCFLMKGKTGINTDLFPNFSKNQMNFAGLPSLLDSIFNILLSDPTEPILLMGPSGFKTFLSKLYLQKAKVVALTQETSVSQLIGTSAFLTKSEAKHFYLDLICKICHIYDSKVITSLKDKLSKRQLQKSDVTSKTKAYLPFIPSSFTYAVDHLTEKLFDDSINENDQNVFSDMIIEFRPGLFLLPILQGESLILKNLSNLPTIVLERFNELFSGKHSLTLNEDFHNTFTKSDQKELTDFGNNLRAFATCPPNTAAKLSEAVLSRFTVINVPEYKNEEQEDVLKSYNNIYNRNLPNEIIKLIIDFSKLIHARLKKNISFTQMINILEICSRLVSNAPSIDPKNILCIVLYRIFVGLLDRRNDYQEKIKTSFDELNISLPSLILKPSYESPFLITNKDGFQGLESKITGLFIHSTDVKETNINVAFTPSFVDMLDIIHLGLSAKVPVILEGNSGQGKQKAIQYIAQHLGYDIVNIVISKSTKVDDLLGKVTIEPDEHNNIHVKTNFTKLAKAIESNSDITNTIFVFHNLNNASPAVLEKLSSLFDRAQSEFSLPDGTTHPKGHINVIGIFNPQNGISNRDKLPTSLIFSSIYHIVENPKKDDILKIVVNLFNQTEFKYESLGFFEKYKITRKFALQNNSSSAVTLYDINKYILFRTVTNGFFKEQFILQMLFGYRFLQQETINQVLKDLQLLQMVFQPKFILNEDKKEIYVKESDESPGLVLKMHNAEQIDTEKINLALRTLTTAQQQCLLFLACSVLSKRACIVQGSTASGKSHIIRLFAQMLGQKLNVYQMNSDTGMSILTGQSVLLNEISETDAKEFQIAFSDLKNFDVLKTFIDENFSVPFKKWKPSQFSELLSMIDQYEKENEISAEDCDLLHRAEAKIRQTMSPAKRFHHEESTFIRSLENGEWVLIDGIESAPQEIAEKFSSLCGDDPEIDLFECGENCFFSRNKPNSRRIHDNFQLFVTYNPSSKIGSKTLDNNFLNKCISFTLPAIDSTTDSSAQILIGSLMNFKYENDFALDIGKRFANTHQFAKIDNEKNRDSYAGDIQFTGRTLTFILKEFKRNIDENGNSTDNIYEVICRSLQSYYWNSYINKEKEDDIKSKMIEVLVTEPQQNDFNINYQGVDPKEKYENLLRDLRNIQLYVSSKDKKPTLEFNFIEFIEKVITVQLIDISFIYDHFYDTLKIIKQQCPIQDPENYSIYENQYSQIQILLNLLKNIKNEMHTLNPQYLNLAIKNDDLISIDNFDIPFSKILLLKKLNETSFFSQTLPYILYDDEMLSLLKIIQEMAHDPNMMQFNQFISKLHEKHDLIPAIEKIFPYHLFKDKSHPFYMILYWMPMFNGLFEHKITFHVEINTTYDFIFSTDYSDIEPTYIFKEENSINLSDGSKLVFPNDNGQVLTIPGKTNRGSKSRVLYGLTNLLFDDHQVKNYKSFKSSDLKTFQKILPSNKTKEFPHLAKLYKQKIDNSLISKLWSIVFNYSQEIVHLLIEFLHPLESDVLRAISILYSQVNNKKITDILAFTVWLSKIGKQNSRLWIIYNNQYEMPPVNDIQKIKSERDQLQKEINYLKISPIIENIWYTSQYINKLQTAQIPLDEAIRQNDKQDKENHIRKQLKELIDQLENTTIKDDDYSLLRKEIIHQILQVSEKSPNDKDFERCQKKVNQFIECLRNKEGHTSSNIILWPNYIPSKQFVYRENIRIKLYEHVLWFSQVKTLIDQICEKNNKKVFEDVFELNKFPEMQSSVHLLMKQLMDVQETESFEINPDDKDTIYSTLNAQFLSKLINDKLFKHVKDLDKIFNDLSLRNEIKDESDIQWIHKKANQANPNMKIVLPKFKFNDLFYLFVSYSGDIKNVSKGPFMSNINCNNLLKNLSKILFADYESFIDCADKIAYSIFRIVFDDDKEVPKNHSDYKNKFDEELKKSKARKNVHKSFKDDKQKDDDYQNKLRNESLMNAAICILEVSDQLSLISSPYKFVHDDKAFLDPNWIKDSEFISKYPSFVYWLVKYPKYVLTLQNFYSNYEFDENSLPFWLFSLRIMSSQNCIKLDIDSSTKVNKIITETMNKYIKSYINSKGMQSLGTDWLSLVLSSVPSEILVPNYRMFYDFFTYLSKDDKQNSDLVDKQKTQSIIDFIENICEMIFNKNANGLFEKHFEDLSDNNLAFIHDPNGFINHKIKAYIKQQFVDFHLSEDFKTIQINSSKIEQMLISKIDCLQELINKENREKEVRFVQSQREEQINRLNQMKNDMKKNIDKYNEKINYVKSGKPKYISTISKIGDELSELQESLSELVKTTEDPLILYKLEWNDNISLQLNIPKNRPISIYYSDKNKSYFPESVKEKAVIKKLTNGKKYDKYEWKEIKFYMIDEGKNNIDQICTQRIDFYHLNARIPTLIFGSRITMQHDEFVQKLISVNNILSSLINEIEQDIINEKITETAFSKPKKLMDEFSSISSLLTVRFTNDDECQSVQSLLNELKQFYSQLERYTYNFNGLLTKKIYTLWKSYSNMSYASKIFTLQYQLPFPSLEKVETAGYNISFDSVAGADFLSLPILSVEKNEENKDAITCCFDSLDCSIGPIIPSLYSGKCAMNFISFIDSPISIEVKTDSYQELFSSRNLIKPDEPCQIYIELPPNPSKEIKDILIETTLIIEAPNSNLLKLELPCNFNFKLVPLAILISCKEFPLSFSDDTFYLCAPKVLPDSKLSFSFLNIYVNEPSKIAYQLIDFDDNEADKPEVKYSHADDELLFHIKDVENVTKLHFTLKVKFSETLTVNVLIDTVIVPFEFGFDLYDYNKMQYVNDNSTIYYSSQFLDREIKLHCRLYGMFFSEVNASIQNNFSYPVSTISSPANIAIQEDTEFDIVIKLKDKITNNSSSYYHGSSYYNSSYYGGSYYNSSYYGSGHYGGSNYNSSGYNNSTTYYSSSYYVSVKIGGIEKKVFLKFEEPNIISQYGNYFNSSYFDIPFVYGFDWKDKKWKLLNSKSYYSYDLVYITSPFHKFDKFTTQNTSNYKISVPRVKCMINYANTFRVSETKTLEITNTINNKFYSFNDKGECYYTTSNKLEFKLYSTSNKYIFGVADNEWYPVFDEYNEYFESFLQLEMTEENIEYAKGKLLNIPDPTFISEMNFIIFARLLRGNIIILKNLYILTNSLPPSFYENEFNDVLNYLIGMLPTLNEDDKFIPIIQYNLIYIFYNLFKKRYQEMNKNDGYLFNKLNETEINDKIDESYNQYIQIDDQAKSKDTFNESQKRLKKIKKKLNNITLHLQPPDEEQYEAYLITDDSKPKPNPKDELPDQIVHSTSQNTFSTDKIINISLPPIDIPSKSQYKNLSIQSLNRFYQSCTEGTRLLPIYVKNMLIQDSIEMKKKAKEYFLKLLQIYKPLQTKDYSFISIAVNTFSLSFASMVNKFEKAGVNFHSLVPKKFILNEQNI